MKVLVIAERISLSERLCKVLTQAKIKVDCMSLYDFDNIGFDIGTIDLIILYKLPNSLITIDNLINTDVFVLVDSLLGLENFDFENGRTKIFLAPFNYNLLCLEIKSLCIFKLIEKNSVIRCNDFYLDLNNRTLVHKDLAVFLKNKEFELIRYLLINRGRILNRTIILENVWDMNADVMTNTVDVHVSKLRKIIKLNFNLDDVIKTVQCVGYFIA